MTTHSRASSAPGECHRRGHYVHVAPVPPLCRPGPVPPAGAGGDPGGSGASNAAGTAPTTPTTTPRRRQRPASSRGYTSATSQASQQLSAGGGTSSALTATWSRPGVRPAVNLEVPHRLLESLGISMQVPTAQEASGDKGRLATRLAISAPEALEQCVEGCYWRWLVHTLLQDLEALKRSLDETQDDLHQRIEERKRIEEIIDRRDRILDQLVGMRATLKVLRVEVPQLRKQQHKLQSEAQSLAAKKQKLQADQSDLEKSLKRCEDRQKNLRMKVDSEESRVMEGQARSEDLKQRIRMLEEEARQYDLLRIQKQDERNQLREEVSQLEGAKARNNKPKRGRGRPASRGRR